MQKRLVKSGKYKNYKYFIYVVSGAFELSRNSKYYFLGYVEVPKTHRLYHEYKEFDPKNSDKVFELESLYAFNGVTYVGNSRVDNKGLWVGFDTLNLMEQKSDLSSTESVKYECRELIKSLIQAKGR